MIRTVERIRTPAPGVFFEEYVRAARPVILTDLFQGQPIRQLSSIERASAALGGMPVQVTQEYVSLAFGLIAGLIANDPAPAPGSDDGGAESGPAVRRPSTVAAYLAMAENGAGEKLLCTENSLHADVEKLFSWPTALFLPREEGRPDDAVKAFMFLGNRGSTSAMHFDGDIASVLHYQVFGRKRHVLAEPGVAKKLMPIDAFSTVLLRSFSASDQQAFLGYLDAYDCVLEPGETLYMPPQFWHHVEYVDTAFSFNMRFGRNRYTRFVHSRLHRDLYRQNVAAKLADAERAEKEYRDHFDLLETASGRQYGSPREKHRAMRAVFKTLYAEMCPDAIQDDYCIASLHEAIEERIVEMAHVYDPNRFFAEA